MGTVPHHHAWWDWGYGGVFICVFLEQIGVPIPAFPALLAAGALAGTGELHLSFCLLTALAASLLADLIWYNIGQAQGGTVLNLMCRLSWRPDTCVSKTKFSFTKYGDGVLLFAKFIPGLSVLAPPLAGMARVPVGRFVLYDGLGAAAWALVPLLAGAYLQKTFAVLQAEISQWKPALPWVCGALIVAVLVWRYGNRRLYNRDLQRGLESAIEPAELRRLLQSGGVTVLDVRDEISARAKPERVAGARWLPYTALPHRARELALDQPLVVYCDCPADQAAVGVAEALRGLGARNVRPLRGGLEGWRHSGGAVETFEA